MRRRCSHFIVLLSSCVKQNVKCELCSNDGTFLFHLFLSTQNNFVLNDVLTIGGKSSLSQRYVKTSLTASLKRWQSDEIER